MTTSIVFDSSMTCLDISYNPNDGNLFFSRGWLTDPTAPRDALQLLRIMKTRETGEEAIIPNIANRATGENISFDTYSYEELKMRRKAEVLKHNKHNINTSNSNNTKKSNYSRIAKGGSSYKNLTNARLKSLKNAQTCNNDKIIETSSSNSGVYGGKTILYVNNNIPYQDSL